MPEIRVVNSSGGAVPFSTDRLAGFLVRLGQPPADALEVAEHVEAELHRGRVDEISTADMRRIAVDLATVGRSRLAVERALEGVVIAEPQPLPVAPPGPVIGAGPLGHATAVHRYLFDLVTSVDRLITRCKNEVPTKALEACALAAQSVSDVDRCTW